MKTTLAQSLVVIVAFALAAPAFAQDAAAPAALPAPNVMAAPASPAAPADVVAPAEAPAAEKSKDRNNTPGVIQNKKPMNPWQKWTSFIDAELDKVDRMDPYGVTAQLPRGYFKIKYEFTTLTAGARYDDRRSLGPFMKPIVFSAANGQKMMSLDLGLSGKGGGHTVQMSYGLLGNLDWYIEIPFQYMDVGFHPKFATIDDQGNKISPAAAAQFGISNFGAGANDLQLLHTVLTKLGRPVPGLRYNAKWAMGDINTGFSWNWFRNSRMSAALTPRVYLPTGRIANPNDSLLYGTGPELDTGLGGWAVGATQGYDVRIFKHSFWIDIIASTEFTTSYGFAQQRDYPTNFVKPAGVASLIDPSGMNFPDLSHLGKNGNPKSFTYVPGWGLSWTAQLQFSVAMLGFGVGYGISHSQMPEVYGDRGFENMVKSLQLLGQQTTQAIQLSASLTLLPLYIPAEIAFKWQKVVDGYNAIVFSDYYDVTVNFYVPVWPLAPRPWPSTNFAGWDKAGSHGWKDWGKAVDVQSPAEKVKGDSAQN